MPSAHSPEQSTWPGRASTSIVPPADYWNHLAGAMPCDDQIRELRRLSDQRLAEFTPHVLSGPRDSSIELLDRVAADGWLERKQRSRCPNCAHQLNETDAAGTACAECGEAFVHHGGTITEIVYLRDLAPLRTVDWVVAIHGMNTTGAWQEAFSWHLSTTWGRSVPVAVYKYGIVIAGVVMAWRRRTLQGELRAKLATLRAEAQAQGFKGRPDVIAHSFGTWLFGHLLRDELARDAADRLTFGRVILTGCVLRPDFDWRSLKAAGLVEEILNHYATGDRVVPLAHATIRDSGPAGWHGFDGDQVINIRAEGYGHRDLFSIDKCVADGKHLRPCSGAPGETRLLDHTYMRYWRPFLTLPAPELSGLPDRVDPRTPWRPLPWPLCGTLFPIFVLPFIGSVLALLILCLGDGARSLGGQSLATHVAGISGTGLAALIALIAIIHLRRTLRGRRMTK